MVKKSSLLRKTLTALACAGFVTSFAGCGTGLLDTEDEKFDPKFSVTLDSASAEKLSNVNYGDVIDLDMTVSLQYATFNNAFKAVVNDETPSSTNPFDLLEDGYFTVSLEDAEGNSLIAPSESNPEEEAVSFAATSSLTQNIAGVENSSYKAASATFKAHLTIELCDTGSALSTNLVIKSTSATGKAGLADALNCSITPSDAVWGLSLPSAGEIIAASKAVESGKTNGATILNLEGRVLKNIAAGTEIGTATLGGNTVTVKAFNAVSKKSRQIPVLLVSDGDFGAGTITLDSEYAAVSAKEVTADDVASIAVPYYGEDYDDYSFDDSTNITYKTYVNSKSQLTQYGYVLTGTKEDSSNVTLAYAQWVAPTLSKGVFVHDATGQSGPRGVLTYDGDHLWGEAATGLSYTDGQKYVVEFDLTVGDASEVYLYNSAVSATKTDTTDPNSMDTLGGIYVGNLSLADKATNYVWGNTSTTAGTYHYKFVIDYKATAGESTITPYENGVAGTAINDIGGGDAQGLVIVSARGTKTTLDNIVVYGLGK
ncbi:MAG: hypothetical protein K6G80_06010 [Treponema sp.]|nr:hypothetical protein [Treponema sp.]